MNCCPVEILTAIFSFACTDGGYTGRALSLVSRDIRTISQPFQLQCLALNSITQLQGLHRILTRRPAHLRRVKHLYINVKSSNTIPIATTPVMQLLTLVAETLHSLAFCTLEQMSSFVPVELPALRELTIYANLSTASFAYPVHAFPRLGYLRISFYNSLPDDVSGYFSRLAPNLTHLRIDGVSEDRYNGDLVRALSALISQDSTDSEYISPAIYTPEVTGFPRTLQKLIITQGATRCIRYEFMMTLYTYLASQLERLGAQDTTGILHILMLAPYKRASSYWDSGTYDEQSQEFHADWMDRIAGGIGCWRPWQISVIPKCCKAPWAQTDGNL